MLEEQMFQKEDGEMAYSYYNYVIRRMIASKLPPAYNVVKSFAYGNPKPCFRDTILLKEDNLLNIIAFK